MKIKFYPRLIKVRILWIALFALFISGCSYWRDFTTYFNLYYNASTKYEEVEAQIATQKKEMFTLTDTKPAGNVSESLNKVVEKLSKILQFYRESSYFDDALLMIGKSFYLQQDYIKALRKFNELVTTFPDGDLALEAKLWLGKANFRLKKFDEGNKYFDEIKEIAEKEDETDILTQIYIEKVSYFISIENYNEAIANAQKLVEVSGDDEKNAVVMYELGKLYLKIEQPENASKAFEAVRDYSPDFDTEFQSRIEFGKTQRLLGNNEIALEIFDDIHSESIYNEYLDQTELQIGITKIELKKYEEAFEQLTEVDTVYKQSQSAGLAKYYLGGIMEKYYGNYDSANVYYSRATTATLPADMVEQVKRKSDVFAQYKKIKTEIAQFDKQLAYVEDPELFIKDSTAYAVEKATADSLNKLNQEEQTEEVQKRDPGERNIQQTNDINFPQAPVDSSLTKSQGDRNMQPPTGDKNTKQPPGDRNSRQTDSRNKRDPEKSGQNEKTVKTVLTPPVRPKITADSVHSLIAKNEFELAGLFLTEVNNTDSAFYYYNRIITRHPKSTYIARSLFALGTCYLTIEQKSKADSIFEIVYNDFKTDRIANAAASKLNKPLINFEFDPAEDLYVLAEKKLKEEKYSEAIDGFKEVSEKYPKSTFAPKAWLASGWILEDNLKMLDSAAVVYDSLLKKFPGTVYASRVASKLSTYKAEKNKQAAVKDSIKMADSLASQKQVKSKTLKADSLATAKMNIKTSVAKDSTANSKQEEFTPDVPIPVDTLKSTRSDSTKKDLKTNVTKTIKPVTAADTSKTEKPVAPPVDSTKIKRTVAPADSTKIKKTIAPVDSITTNKLIVPIDSSGVYKAGLKTDSSKTNTPSTITK